MDESRPAPSPNPPEAALRIGLAGVGRIGAFHAETLRTIAEIDSLVVADADAARAREVAALKS